MVIPVTAINQTLKKLILSWLPVQNITVEVAGIIIDNALQVCSVQITTLDEAENVVRTFSIEQHFKAMSNVSGTEATNTQEPTAEIFVASKSLFTKIFLNRISDLIFFGITEYGPVWINMSGCSSPTGKFE